MLARASGVISHGGSGITQSAFAAGRPQLLLPLQFEADLTAHALEALGTGIRLGLSPTGESLASGFRRLIDDVTLRDQAAAWAGLVAERRPAASLDTVVAECCALL